jgi:AcrR family transcriptional regulator
VTAPGAATRERILDAAFGLTAGEHAAGLSMRRLAEACGLNVATLYHHFPSKADLLHAVLEERGYPRRMGEEGPPPSVLRGRTERERVRRLVGWLWHEAEDEEAAWRLLLGEGLRGEPAAREEADRLLTMLEPVLAGWLAEVAPSLGDRTATAARLVRATILTLAVEHLALGADPARASARIDDLARVLLPT